MVVIVVQGSNLKVGEFEGLLSVFDMGKAFELGMFMDCLGLRESGDEVTLEEALETGKMLLDWGCPVVILTQHICLHLLCFGLCARYCDRNRNTWA